MKTNEMRIGNFLKRNNKIVQVNGLSRNEVKYTDNDKGETVYDIMFFQPIELTEEVLLNIGFKKEERMSGILYYLDYEINEDENIRVRYVIYNSNALPLLRITSPSPIISESYELTKRGIKHLHQLQNAYYCLTGNELNIEL